MNKRMLLRFLFFGLMLLTALSPHLSRKKKKSLIRRAVLADASRSMLGDRWARAEKVFKQFEDAAVDWYLFSGELERTENRASSAGPPDGNLTDIPRALGELSDYSEVYIISDGANNGPTEGAGGPARVHSIYVGEKPSPDGSIEEAESPFYAFAGTPAELKVKVKFRNFLPNRSRIVLKSGGKIISEHSFRPFPETVQNIEFVQEKEGEHVYQLWLEGEKGEADLRNNSREIRLEVLPEKFRVLYICGRPGWEYRFLRSFIKSNPRFELISFIILRNPEDVSLVSERESALIPFPAREIFLNELPRYHLLILENFDYKRFFPAAYLGKVSEFVEKGGAFLMIGGEDAFGVNYAGSPVEGVLPVRIAGTDQFQKKTFTLRTKEPHPVISGEKSWNFVMEGLNRVQSAEGKVLLETTEGEPFLCVKETGRGRTAAVLGNTTWRWQFLSLESYFYWDFWSKLVYWLVRSPFLEEVRIFREPRSYKRGEVMKWFVEKENETAELKLFVRTPSGKKEERNLEFPFSQKRIPVSYIPLESGPYNFSIRGPDGRSRKDFTISVEEIDFETSRSEGDHEYLKELSAAHGGEFFNFDEEKRLREFLEGESVLERIYPFRSAYWLGFLFLFLLSLWLWERYNYGK
ncbi:MAG TPA: glutamine amidotransferase [bacterium]|nr:glutamine amidotransferase [bacterium]